MKNPNVETLLLNRLLTYLDKEILKTCRRVADIPFLSKVIEKVAATGTDATLKTASNE